VMLDMPSADCFLFSEDEGLIEPRIDLGETVRSGDELARIWPVDRTGEPPRSYRARMDGMLVGRHFPGLIKPGDCLAVLGVEV
jgi:N-alpha-acetyl-L-2,4-diaminobutyrate deacetylase